MQKGIVLFDIQDFLYQGLKGQSYSVQEINERQSQVLQVLHVEMSNERKRRQSSSTPVPTVDILLPIGDGYYLLCKPDLTDILDISRCIMAILDAQGITAYCVAHVGEVNVFTDTTCRENATGFDIGLTSRLQEVSRTPGKLVCSEELANIWRDNDHFDLQEDLLCDVAKDNIKYCWNLATPKGYDVYRAKFIH